MPIVLNKQSDVDGSEPERSRSKTLVKGTVTGYRCGRSRRPSAANATAIQNSGVLERREVADKIYTRTIAKHAAFLKEVIKHVGDIVGVSSDFQEVLASDKTGSVRELVVMFIRKASAFQKIWFPKREGRSSTDGYAGRPAL